MKIKLGKTLAYSLIGNKEKQEDHIYVYDEKSCIAPIYILCDGMGGHKNGDVASRIVTESFAKWFNEHPAENGKMTENQFDIALNEVYLELDAADRENPQQKKMGTTLTLIYFHSGGAFIAHIGDSRVYHIRPGYGIKFCTRDHSLMRQLIDIGEITKEEALTHPQRHVITRVLQPGVENRTVATIDEIKDIQRGDYFFMCSDGVFENVSEKEIYKIISRKFISDKKKKEDLIAASGDSNNDNYSAIIIPIQDVEYATGESPKSENFLVRFINRIFMY